METSSKASKAGTRFFAFLTASATLAIATLVSASSSHQADVPPATLEKTF